MSVSVCCPGCQLATAVPPELLGRTGRCNRCARRIRLATPVAELLDDLEPETVGAAPTDPTAADDLPPLGELMPVEEPVEGTAASVRPAPLKPVVQDDEPDEPVPLDEPEEPAARRPRSERAAASRRGPALALVAVLALAGLIGGGVGGVLLVRALTAPEPAKPDTPVAEAPAPQPQPPQPPPPPDPKLPDPKLPDPKLPDPKLPDPKLPDPKLPNPKLPDPKLPAPKLPEPPKVPAAPKNALKLPGAVATFTPGAGGRYVVFQLADGMLVLFDARAGKTFWTLNGAKPDDLIAVSRQKLYIGKVKDARIDRFDLATAANEGGAAFEGAAGTGLKYLAVGASSDGPILVVTQKAENSFGMRLVDPVTFANLPVPIDEGAIAGARAFPFTVTTVPTRVAVGADGRTITLGNRYLVRTDDRYRGGLLGGAGIVFPGADGQAFFGAGIYGPDGLRHAPAPLPAGFSRRYLPAAGGPLAVSLVYKPTELAGMKLYLHAGSDPNPLGPLPGGEEVGAWAKGDGAWSARLHQRLAFLPDPGLLLFVPPGSDTAQVWPVEIGAMLRTAGRDPVFTSVAPAEVRAGRPYEYRATAVGARGPLTFALEAGPPTMQMTPDGRLTWAAPDAAKPGHDVRVAVRDADGRKTVQAFRLVVTKDDAAAGPKKPDPFMPPEKDPPGAGVPGAARAVKLPGAATEAASAGNGRFVVLNMPAARQVAIFDAKEGKVVKSLTVEADAVVAAGRDHLFVVNNEARTLQRWSLASFEKEATDKLPAGGPFSHAYIGSNSTGPLVLCAKGGRFEPTKAILIDPFTLREVPLAGAADGAEAKAMPQSVRLSPDGQVFTWAPDRTNRGAVVATVADGKAAWKLYPNVANPLSPSAGGRFFYAYEGAYDDQLRRVFPAADKPARVGVFAAAAQGNLFLEATPAPPIPNGLIALQRANLFVEGQAAPFALIDGLDKPVEAVPRFIHLAPRYGVLVMLTRTGTELAVHPFDLDAALAKATADYLLVLADAPARPVAGGWFGYRPVVKSKKGGVKLKLDAGPEGMKMTPAGGLAWDVPPGAAGKEFAVALTVTDASGQEVRQAFRLLVAPPELPVPAPAPVPAPKLPVAPPPREVER